MNVLLINIDSTIPNIALEKIALWHTQNGDTVYRDFPLMRHKCEKVYVSCLLKKNRHLCNDWEDDSDIGGTGYDIAKKLPPEIEAMKPKINYGFTSRGCIRKCEFCVVPEKEGKIRVVGDIYDFWDGVSKKIVILDNNILALPDHFVKICGQIKKHKLEVDFNQGLDLRLLFANKSLTKYLKEIKHDEYKFAWDLDDFGMVEKIEWLYSELKRCNIYILCGILPYETILKKVEILKKIGHNGYIMRLDNIYHEKRYITLARWVNQHHMFHTKTFTEFETMSNLRS